jgi:tetratricopeptide (TPR) repeat protein
VRGKWVCCFLLIAFAASAPAERNPSKPLECSQFMAWVIGGVSSQRLTRVAQQRGVAFAVDESAAEALQVSGAQPELIQSLRAMHASGNASCPAPLAQAGALARQKRYQESEIILRKLLATDSQNAGLHFALAYIRQQRGDWDDAFDHYSDSRDLMPGFPDTHSRLAYVFYRSDEGDNTIAEARTALSMDPQNAEAYRYLGLGLFANSKYDAAMHAFQESLVREPGNADTYYDMGITLHGKGDSRGAAEAQGRL